MPKDWDHHKAEIERLYIVERRPLKEVRNILKTRFAFDASVRAYRMKLDEWRLWKNNSKTERRSAKAMTRHMSRNIEVFDSEENGSSSMVRATQSPPPVDILAPDDFEEISGLLVPSGPLDISDLFPLISVLHHAPERGLEIMLMKWKSDGSYLKAALRYLWDNRLSLVIYFYTPEAKSIFYLIDAVLEDEEKLPLVKRCLGIDFEFSQGSLEGNPRSHSYLFPDWMTRWRKACTFERWEDVKRCLSHISPEFGWPGSLFTSCAPPFLAEKLLQRNLGELESWRDADRNRTISASEVYQASACLYESMEILKVLQNDRFKVDNSSYLRLVEINNWVLEQHYLHDQLHSNQREEYRKKFLQLKTLYKSVDGVDGMAQNLLNTASLLKESRSILDTIQCGDESVDGQHRSMAPNSSEIPITGLQSPSGYSAHGSITQDDARRALDTLLNFFNQAPSALVDQNEYMTVLKLTEKLRLRQSNGPLPGSLHRIAEQDCELSARPSKSIMAQPASSPSSGGAVQTLLENIYKRWGWEEDIGGEVHDLLEHIETHCTSGPLCAAENIFILVTRIIPRKDQISFTAAILAAIDESFSIFPPECEMDWNAWLIVHNSSNLERLQESVDLPFPLKSYLDDRIRPEAVKLILNASVVLAGERTLSRLKTEMREWGQTDTPSSLEFDKVRQEYMIIMDKLRARKLKVDQEWYDYLGRMLAWETTDDMLFETSGEESDGSGDETDASEVEPT